MIYLFIYIWMGSKNVIISQTGVYSELTRKTVAITSDTSVFVFDGFEQQILLFKPGQSVPLRVAQKGPGPGELNRPNQILIQGERLYVISAGSIQCFDLDGNFLSQTKVRPGTQVQKTQSGWLLASGTMSGRTTLTISDETLKPLDEIAHWHEAQPRVQVATPGKPIQIPVYPDLGDYAVTSNGLYVFFRAPEQAVIHIYSVLKRKKQGTIALEKRYRFNPADGEALLRQSRETFKGSPVSGDFPEFYPYTSGLYADLEGNIVIRRLTGFKALYMRYQPGGVEIDGLLLDNQQMMRMLRFDEDGYCVSFQTEDGDMGIARVAPAEITTFLENHPIQ